MAYTPADDTLLDPNKQNQQGGAQAQSQDPNAAGGAAPTTGGSGQDPFAGSGGVSTAGVGSGGTGGWTNIQAYLNANQGNSGSADALNNQVGKAFDQEDQQFKDQSGQAKQQAQSEMDRSNMGQDQASKLLSDAAGSYSYGKDPNAAASNDPYQSIINQFQTARKDYSGPSSFTYAPDSYSKVQDYGSNLGNDTGFNSLMQGVYNNAAGGQMNSGQQALQTQLDTNNPALAQARQGLLSKYSGLSNEVNQGTQDTDQFVKNAAGTVGQNKAALDQYLNQTGTADKNKIDSGVSRTNDAINTLAQKEAAGLNSQAGMSDSWNVTPSQMASADNLKGVQPERNSWNAIQDIFNRPEQKVGFTKEFDPTGELYNWSGNNIIHNGNSSGAMTLQGMQDDPFFSKYLDPASAGLITGQGGPLSTVSGGMTPRRI